MNDKITITITTDKPVKIRVAQQEDDKLLKVNEQDGLQRLLKEIKGGSGYVAKSYESRKANR